MNLIRTFVFSSLVVFPMFLPQIIFAQEFDFEFIDSKIYPISYKLTNVTLIDVIQNPPTDFAFVINGTDGQLFVSIPKNIPRDIADNFPIAYIIFNGVEMDKAVESNCSYDYTFPIDKESRVEFIFGSPPSGTPLVYDKISPGCDEKINDNSDDAVSQNSIYDTHGFILCGTVISKDTKGYEDVSGPLYTIKVENNYKGNSNSTLIAIGSEDSNGPRSMLPIDVGQKAIFYVDFDGKHYVLSPYTAVVSKCASHYVPTPLGQYRFGIEPINIRCIDEHELILKSSNGLPACVSTETKQKLIERGWAKS